MFCTLEELKYEMRPRGFKHRSHRIMEGRKTCEKLCRGTRLLAATKGGPQGKSRKETSLGDKAAATNSRLDGHFGNQQHFFEK